MSHFRRNSGLSFLLGRLLVLLETSVDNLQCVPLLLHLLLKTLLVLLQPLQLLHDLHLVAVQ